MLGGRSAAMCSRPARSSGSAASPRGCDRRGERPAGISRGRAVAPDPIATSTCAWRRLPRACRCSSSPGAFGASWGGRLADHVARGRAMRRCVLITAACLLAGALVAQSLVVLLLLLAVAGVANAVCQPAINLFVSEQIRARPAGPRLRHQAVGNPGGDPRERAGAPGSGDPARLAGHLRALRARAARRLGGATRRGSGARVAAAGVAAAVARARPHGGRSGARHGRAERARRVPRGVGRRRGDRRRARPGCSPRSAAGSAW